VGKVGKGSTPLIVGASVSEEEGNSPTPLIEGVSDITTGAMDGAFVGAGVGVVVGVPVGSLVGDLVGVSVGGSVGAARGASVSVPDVGNGSIPADVGVAVSDTGGRDGKNGGVEDEAGFGVAVGDGVMVGEGVTVGAGETEGADETVGVIAPARFPVKNRLIASSMQGMPPGTSAATTATVSMAASKHTSSMISSRMTMISPGPNGFAALASCVKSAGTPSRNRINPIMSMTSTVFRLVT
jgi:hypothetical protein